MPEKKPLPKPVVSNSPTPEPTALPKPVASNNPTPDSDEFPPDATNDPTPEVGATVIESEDKHRCNFCRTSYTVAFAICPRCGGTVE